MAQGEGIALIVGPRGLILRSVNAGATWVEVPSGTTDNLRAVAIADDGTTAVAVGARGDPAQHRWRPYLGGTRVASGPERRGERRRR
jgi:photosystem II stability/assembly factor-like uncharacterized protein